MASSAGKLVVEILATTAAFQSDLSKASAAAETHARKIDRALAGVRASIVNNLVGAAAAVGATFSAAGLVNLIRGTIDAQAHLLQLSKSTGVSVEQLGGLGFAATQTGGNLDDMASAFRRFSVNAAAAAAGSEKEQEVFKALGISVRDINTLKPDELFIKAADAFKRFEESPQKAALANAAFGKSYQGILPTLNQGGDLLRQNIAYFERFGGVSTETALRAEEFKIQLEKASLLSGAFGRNLTADLLPGLKTLVDYFVDAKEKGGQFTESAQHVADVIQNLAIFALYTAHGFDSLGTAVGAAAARIAALAQGDLGRFKFIGEDEAQRVDEAGKKFDALIDEIRNAKKEQEKPFVGPPAPPQTRTRAPDLTSADSNAAARKALEAALRGLDLFIASEQDLLRQRERFLTDYYQSDELGIEDYFSRRAGVLEESLAKERAAFDEEEKLIRGRISKAKPTERAEDEKLLADVIGKRSKVDQDAAGASILAYREQGRALRDFRDKVEELGIAEAEAQGNSSAAAARFDFDHRREIAQLELQRNSTNEIVALQARAGLVLEESARKRYVTQQALNAATQAYGNSLEELGLAQDRLNILQQSGGATELDSLRAQSQLTQSFIPLLESRLKLAEALALKSGKDEDLLAVDRLKVKLEELKSTGDLVAKTFNKDFAGSFSDAIVELTSGTKKFRDVLLDLGKSIEGKITKRFADDISEKLFTTKDAPLGFLGDFFSKSVVGDAGGAAALSGAGVTLSTAGVSLTGAATALYGAAGVLSAGGAAGALGAIGGSDTFGLGSLGLFQGAFAEGSPSVPRTGLALVHKGEAIIPAKFNQAAPAAGSGRHPTIHMPITINVPAGTSTATAAQVARETGLAVRRELRAAGMGP